MPKWPPMPDCHAITQKRRSAGNRTTFTLRIDMDNDAFTENGGAELARILRAQAAIVEGYGADVRSASVRHVTDINGNRVGEWIIAEHQTLKFTR